MSDMNDPRTKGEAEKAFLPLSPEFIEYRDKLFEEALEGAKKSTWIALPNDFKVCNVVDGEIEPDCDMPHYAPAEEAR